MKKELQIGILIWILERLSETDWVDEITQIAIKSYTKAFEKIDTIETLEEFQNLTVMEWLNVFLDSQSKGEEKKKWKIWAMFRVNADTETQERVEKVKGLVKSVDEFEAYLKHNKIKYEKIEV